MCVFLVILQNIEAYRYFSASVRGPNASVFPLQVVSVYYDVNSYPFPLFGSLSYNASLDFNQRGTPSIPLFFHVPISFRKIHRSGQIIRLE